MENDIRLRRLQFRAWHRGTREADMMIGGFFDRYGKQWLGSELNWFERLLEEDDVDIMAWAIGKQPVPDDFAGAQLEAMQKLDFIDIPDCFLSHPNPDRKSTRLNSSH